MFEYQAQNFEHLLGLPGMSDALLTNHITLYQGYVTNVNKLIGLLDTMEFSTPEYAELQRRFGWEWNGMRLHELYFGNLQKETVLEPTGTIKEKIEQVYGSVENWKKNFENLGTMRGIGWVALVHDTQSGELFNIWINEHDLGILAGSTVLLIMDVFEHAYMLDYGIKRADYLSVFMNAIDWTAVEQRYLDSQNRNS